VLGISLFGYLLLWSVPTALELVVADDGIRATLSLRSSDGLWSASTHRGGHSAALPLFCDVSWSVPTALELVVADDGVRTTLSLRSSDFNTVEVLHSEILSAP